MRLRNTFRPASLALLAAAALPWPASAHPGHGDAHAEPWYNQPRESLPADAGFPADAAPAPVEGKGLRSAESGVLPDESPERAPRSETRAPEAAREGTLTR
jgi:hypothetical protein